MDELLEEHFPDDQFSSIWTEKQRPDELGSEGDFTDLENILSQTRLDLTDFDAMSSPSSSAPQSPQILQTSSEFINDDELVTLPIRQLNKRIQNLPKEEIKKIRKRRRSLKNRGYATSCRQRRVALKETLETQNQRLKMQLREAKGKLNTAVKDRDTYKTKYEQLREVLITLHTMSS